MSISDPGASKGGGPYTITFGQHKKGHFVPADTSKLSDEQKRTLEATKEQIKNAIPSTKRDQTYVLTSQQIMNTKTGKTFRIHEQSVAKETIKIVSGKEKAPILVQVKKTPLQKTITPLTKEQKHIKRAVNESYQTERSFHKNIKELSDAYTQDQKKFVRELKRHGVKDHEIELIFEPLVAAEKEVASFENKLQKLNQELINAKTETEYRAVLSKIDLLYQREYGKYVKALKKMAVAYRYMTTHNNKTKRAPQGRFTSGVAAYFKDKPHSITRTKNLDFSSILIQCVQRPPRHNLLYQDMMKHAPSDMYRGGRDSIKKHNNSLDSVIPPDNSRLSRSDLTMGKLPVKELKSRGWKESEIKQFVSISNAYGQELKDFELINNLIKENPKDIRTQAILRDLALQRQNQITRLNNNFLRWGGPNKAARLSQDLQEIYKEQGKSASDIHVADYGALINERTQAVDAVYISSGLSRTLVRNKLSHSPFAKTDPKGWQKTLHNQGWSQKDITRFNAMYFEYTQECNDLRIAYERAGKNANDPTFKKIAKQKIKNIKRIERKFNAFGGLKKTKRLDKAINNWQKTLTERYDKMDRGYQKFVMKRDVLPSFKYTNFHSKMVRRHQFVNQMERAIS